MMAEPLREFTWYVCKYARVTVCYLVVARLRHIPRWSWQLGAGYVVHVSRCLPPALHYTRH